MNLTVKKIRDANPARKTRIIWDGEVKGLELRITSAGVKSYVLSYRFDGRKRLMTLARTSEISLEDVRRIAGKALVTVRQGRDPMDERNARREIPTVRDTMERYLEEHLARRLANGRLAEGTLKEYRRQAAKYILPTIGSKRVTYVERRDIERLLADLPPVMANRVCALLSAFFNQL